MDLCLFLPQSFSIVTTCLEHSLLCTSQSEVSPTPSSLLLPEPSSSPVSCFFILLIIFSIFSSSFPCSLQTAMTCCRYFSWQGMDLDLDRDLLRRNIEMTEGRWVMAVCRHWTHSAGWVLYLEAVNVSQENTKEICQLSSRFNKKSRLTQRTITEHCSPRLCHG